ncbi:unnamed protein product [marine sediment metagenome]|uniref:Uncharacterized protein n=1 Tax=marine sediment metagenome TaxID=412755 RepID=X0V2M4_9ZZZZ
MFDSRIETIEKVTWNGEDEVEIRSDGGVWGGSKRKDFWNPNDDWESIITVGVRIRYWVVSYSIVLGFEVERNRRWAPVWCKANNFQRKAEREKASKAYADFAENEGKKIATAIDEGKNYDDINKLVSDGHTGNTFGWALNYGISNAKNKTNADIVRKQHNIAFGVDSGEGVVNPAILTVAAPQPQGKEGE